MSYHNITWESYTRYSPTRHHETIEETSADALGKRKDAYCMCTYMECGRKFKMLKNLEEHVTLYHNISWQLYTQYYHRSVRKTPEESAKKCKSPKAEKKTSPYPAASSIKTSESPSPSSNMRSSSNGSASTPVSVGGLGLASPVPASPLVSFMSQSAPPYGQYPYLTAQVPLVPAAIIQYQPMLTAPVIGYASPSTLPLSQGYLSQSTIPMAPLPDQVSWFSHSQPTSQLPSQHPQYQQQDSGILNLSCPKSKKTKSSLSPLSSSKSLDLTTSSRSSSDRSSTLPSSSSQPYNLSSSASTARYLANSYGKPSENELRRSKSDTWNKLGNPNSAIHRKSSYGNLPDTSNGVIVIEPDDQFDDAKYRQKLVDEIVRFRDSVEKPNYKSTYHEEEYKKRTSSSGTYGHFSATSVPSKEFSYYDPVKGFGHIAAKPYPNEEKLGGFSADTKYVDQRHPGDLSIKQTSTCLESKSQNSTSFDSTTQSRKQTSHNLPSMLEKKSNEIFQTLNASANQREVRSAFKRCASSSFSVAQDNKSLTDQIHSGLFHGEKAPPRNTEKCMDSPVENDIKSHIETRTQAPLEKDAQLHVEKETCRTADIKAECASKCSPTVDRTHLKKERKSMSRGASLPAVKKLKRSASLPNLNILSEDRLVIDLTDEEEIDDNEKNSTNTTQKSPESNQVKRRKITNKSHLKSQPKPKRDCKTKDNQGGVKTKRKVRKLSPKLATIFRTNCIKRKYGRLLKKEVVTTGMSRTNQNSSPFCKLILFSTSNTCLFKKSCDTANTTHAETSGQRRVRTVPKPKRKKRIIREKSTEKKSTSVPKSPAPNGTTSTTTKPEQHQVPTLKVLAELKYNSQICTYTDLKHSIPQKRTPCELLTSPDLAMSSSAPSSSQTSTVSPCSKGVDDPKQTLETKMSSSSLHKMKQSSSTLPLALPLSFKRSRITFTHSKDSIRKAEEGKNDEGEAVFSSLYCEACRLEFDRSEDYVRHRFKAHRTYRCKVCDRSKHPSHLYRYEATLGRHLMLDHRKGTSALDPTHWAIADSYGGQLPLFTCLFISINVINFIATQFHFYIYVLDPMMFVL